MLYVGVTNNLERRIYEHKNKLTPGFTSKYNINKLVFCEEFNHIDEAIAAEKQIKGWLRSKKDVLITKFNPAWEELYPSLPAQDDITEDQSEQKKT